MAKILRPGSKRVRAARDRQPRRVVIVTDLARTSGRDMFYGIARFTRMRPEWSLMLFGIAHELSPERFRELERDGCDGMLLATSGAADERLSGAILRSAMPVVCIGDPGVIASRRHRVAFLRLDNRAVGAAGARYLVSLGNWRAFGYVPLHDPGAYWSRDRMAGFAEELRARGRACEVFRGESADRAASDAALREWLAALPKPCAVMAATDMCAAAVLDACREAGVSVPGQVALLGVDNDVALCDFMRPSLSSVLPDHEGLGFAAARELAALMDGRPRGPARSGFSALRVVERESTAHAAPAAHLITGDIDYIRRNAHKGLKVQDVVRHLGVSRRLADMRFREFHGKTILATITGFRLEEVKRRLEWSGQPIAALSRACGFRNTTYLKTLFKRHTGMTMREYRSLHSP